MKKSRIVLAGAALLSLSAPVSAQQQPPQVMYNCPPGYVCSPTAQSPDGLAPRAMTPEELQAVRGAVVQDAAGAILTPADIAALRDRGLAAQSAANWPGMSTDQLPDPRPRVIVVKDATKQVPDRINLSIGVVTPVTFLDRMGKPWPIVSVAYDPRTFSQDGNGCGGQTQQQAAPQAAARPTTINLMPCRYQTFGNISVALEGMAAPVVLLAQSGMQPGTMDLPVTVRMVSSSPETAAASRQAEQARRQQAMLRAYETAPAIPQGVDKDLDAFLTGVPPRGAEAVQTNMPGVSVWLFEGRMYLRGPVTVINPAYDAMGAGTNGQFVWRFSSPVARVRVVQEGGEERSVTIGI